ncbi:GNAT family N-acetyltransferase [Georgenia phoenicis]|uniref:GNAT family N-acetyltransferase n=1 Tax=unclassified Georgenia TaxID=2626815 RepID=UPI0039AF7F4E
MSDTVVRRARRTKRIFDSLAVLASSPVWAPVTAATYLAVRMRDGSPAIFRQTRTGLNGRPFEILKFRTMAATTGPVQNTAVSDADRLTPLGRFLRRTSLDELPQLINVLRGDMSLVGPRPLYPHYMPHYTGREHRRHAMRPGITGLAQTSGRNNVGWEERLETDVRYVENWSFRGDLAILLATVMGAVRSSDVSVVAGETGEPLHIHRSYPTSDTLGLRRFSVGDIPARVAWMSDPEVRRHMRLPANPSVDETTAWFRRVLRDPTRVDLVVYQRSDGSPVAMLGARMTPAHTLPELYLFVAPGRHGTGVGTQSMSLFYRWLDTTGRFPGTSLSVAKDNHAAVRLYERFGYTTDDADDDRLRMSLSVEDWRSHHVR